MAMTTSNQFEQFENSRTRRGTYLLLELLILSKYLKSISRNPWSLNKTIPRYVYFCNAIKLNLHVTCGYALIFF
jgi:hypothetical protein